jgi:outer membrane protein W
MHYLMRRTITASLFFNLLLFQITAQSEGKLVIETQFDVLTRSESIQPSLKFRYFLDNEHVLRATFNTHYRNSSQQIAQFNGSGIGSVQRIHSMTNVSFGYEHHIAQDKFSPYVGGEFLIGIGKTDTYGLRTDSLVFVNSLNYSIKRPIQQFGVHLFSGVDVAIYKGLYVGTEIGILFSTINYKEGEYRKDDSASLTDAVLTEKIPQLTIRQLLLSNMGIIRVGWRF